VTAGGAVVVDNDRLRLAAVSTNLIEVRGSVSVGHGWTRQLLGLALRLRFGFGPLQLLSRRGHERAVGIRIVGLRFRLIGILFVRRSNLGSAITFVGFALELLLGWKPGLCGALRLATPCRVLITWGLVNDRWRCGSIACEIG
jgi:hypothetical protein